MQRLHLPIASPCHEDWDAMSEQPAARRFCDQCDKSVHDLSSMTENAARDLLSAPRSGRICIRYKSDATTGRVRFADPAAPARTPRRFAGWRAGLATAAASLALAACADPQRQPVEVKDTHCTYEVGPFGYTLERGEGTCPSIVEAQTGQVALDPEPQHVKGDFVGVEEDPVPTMGEEVAVQPDVVEMGDIAEVPCDPEPVVEPPHPEDVKMGKMVAPMDEPHPEPAPVPTAEPKRF